MIEGPRKVSPKQSLPNAKGWGLALDNIWTVGHVAQFCIKSRCLASEKLWNVAPTARNDILSIEDIWHSLNVCPEMIWRAQSTSSAPAIRMLLKTGASNDQMSKSRGQAPWIIVNVCESEWVQGNQIQWACQCCDRFDIVSPFCSLILHVQERLANVQACQVSQL